MKGEFPHSTPHLAIPKHPKCFPKWFLVNTPTGWRSLPERLPHHKRDPLAEQGRALISRSWRKDTTNIQHNFSICIVFYKFKERKAWTKNRQRATCFTMAMAGSSVLLKSLEGCPCLCSVGGQVIQYGLLHRPKALAIDPRKNQRHQPRIDGQMGKKQEPWSLKVHGLVCLGKRAGWISQEQTPNSKLLIPRWIWPILGRYNYHQVKSMWQQKILNLRLMFAIPDHDFPLLKYAKVSYSHPIPWHLCASKKWGDRT